MTKSTHTIKRIERLKNSYAGNPAFKFTFDGGLILRTKANISDAYKVSGGWEGKRVEIETETTPYGKTFIIGINE